ncbi:DUF4390 domain-containing protein [Desulforhopalus sp. IMCC35007]|uniref:DUF4390 domain-containing protein n=1 Tax=Desulforhopalus sp. IMCC35007 TaxID=2569543 RepID=UPI0010AEE8D4|nr:DUF4390 domain-containing protein [Desulforhopalus sp. IMCC35007]TKB06059.1 DUF4390 domain-containing protein [Desulforhopalus sp. IMCC35007]
MIIFFRPLFLLFLSLIIAAGCTPASADNSRQASIEELTATTSETHLIMFGTLVNSFTSEMIEILNSGIPLHFSFFVELHKIEKDWPEEQIASLNFQHIMTFDTLKEMYRVTIEEDNNKEQSFKSFFEAQKAINEINGAKVVELKQLVPETRYKLKIKAELFKKTLPLSLHSIFPFLSWWDIETDWHSIEFTY